MTSSLRLTRYFRMLALIGLCGGIGLTVFTGMGMKWVAFSRVFGTYVGMFFPPLAVLELFALVCEKYLPERNVSRSTTVASIVWSLIVLVFMFIVVARESEWQFRFGQTSDSLYRLFPDKFWDLLGGSVMIVCVWLIPLSILSGFIEVLKRWRHPGIRQALILWQASILIVLAWGTLLQISLKSRIVSVAESYFSPVKLHVWGSEGADPVASFTLVLIFWCALFFLLRYVIKYYGFKNTISGFVLSLLLATGLIFIPHIPAVSKRWINLVNEGGWYDFKAPYLLPPRIWVASLMLMGGTVVVAGLVWILRGEKSTVQSG